MADLGIERVLVAGLAGLGRICVELPADLATVLPLVQVVRIGGGSSDETRLLQFPSVSVDCFATNRAAVTDLARDVDRRLRALAGTTVAGCVIGKVQTVSGPAWRPWDDTTVRRMGATYQIGVRVPRV